MNLLVTGCAGFIGYHLSKKLQNEKKINVIGLDNINAYYDVDLKKERLKELTKNKHNFRFYKSDITNINSLEKIIKKEKINIIVNLAAQAGVRHSINKPDEYFQNNMIGFFNILEVSRKNKINHLIYASTSSVYGNSKKFPLKENFNTDNPLSFYAATKKSNEVMAYSYSNIYKLPCTGLRFFTVYGDYGRPDMSLYKFTESLLSDKPIDLYNKGNHIRDFTYVLDVVRIIKKILQKPPKKNIPHEIYNISSEKPKELKHFLKLIENNINKKFRINKLPMQKGDVHKTHGSMNKLKKKINIKPKTKIDEGIKNFISWFKKYYNI